MSFLIADLVVVGLFLIAGLCGYLLGLGKILKFTTKGFFGILISILLCIIFGSVIYEIPLVNELILKLGGTLTSIEGFFGDLFYTVHLNLIIFYFALFLIFQLLKRIAVLILQSTLESEHRFFRFVNKSLGVIGTLILMFMVLLAVFAIVNWVGGETAINFKGYFEGGILRLDYLFDENPLVHIFSK